VVSFGQIPVADLGYTYSEDQLQQLEDRLPDGVQTRYTYEPGTDRIVERSVRSGASLLLRESRTWSEGRLATIETRRSDGTVVAGYGWGYDAQGRRTTRTLDSGEAWECEYNRRNEVIRGIKKNGATPLDGYDFGYGGIGNRRSETRAGGSNLGHVAHVFVEAEPGVTSVEADVPQGNTTARVSGIRQGNPLKLRMGWGNRVEFRSIRANGLGQTEFLRTLKQPVSVPEVRWTYT
jgi:YD repeat-containing protein